MNTGATANEAWATRLGLILARHHRDSGRRDVLRGHWAMAIAQSGAFNLGFATMPVVFQQLAFGQLLGALWLIRMAWARNRYNDRAGFLSVEGDQLAGVQSPRR